MTTRNPAAHTIPIQSPVERLEGLLVSGLNADSTLQTSNAGKVLAHLLGLPKDLRSGWCNAYVEVLELLKQAQGYASERIPDFEKSPHALTFKGIKQVFEEMNLETQWSAHAQRLTHLVTIGLPHTVFATVGANAHAVVDSEMVEGLRTDLDGLLAKVLASSLPQHFKVELVRGIEELRDALVRFSVWGMEGVLRATALVVGTVATNESAAKADAAITRETLETASRVEDLFLKAAKIGKIVGPFVLGLLNKGQ